jgi:hypothetical protein
LCCHSIDLKSLLLREIPGILLLKNFAFMSIFSSLCVASLFWDLIWDLVAVAKIFAKTFAKIFVIFVTFWKLFSRKAKINFCENTKTKIFVSTLTGIPVLHLIRILKHKFG